MVPRIGGTGSRDIQPSGFSPVNVSLQSGRAHLVINGDDRHDHDHGRDGHDVRGDHDRRRDDGGHDRGHDRGSDHNLRDGDVATTSNRLDHKDGNSTMVGLLPALPAHRGRIVLTRRKLRGIRELVSYKIGLWVLGLWTKKGAGAYFRAITQRASVIQLSVSGNLHNAKKAAKAPAGARLGCRDHG